MPQVDDSFLQMLRDRLTQIENRISSIDTKIAHSEHVSSDSRGRLYDKVDNVATKVDTIAARVDKLEYTMTTVTPTVAEIINIKAQVAGAGKLGRLLWMIGGFLIASAAYLTGAWHNFLSYFTTRP